MHSLFEQPSCALRRPLSDEQLVEAALIEQAMGSIGFARHQHPLQAQLAVWAAEPLVQAVGAACEEVDPRRLQAELQAALT